VPSAYTQLHVHLVWATWDRLPLISPEMESRLLGALRDKCDELGCQCLAAATVADHVHLVVRHPASLSVAELVGQLKGSSSHLANHLRGSSGDFRWQGSYGAFSVSSRNLAAATAYVLGQKQHHSEHTVHPEAERSEA